MEQLQKTYRRFLAESQEILDISLRSQTLAAARVNPDRLPEYSAEMSLVKLLDTWSRFCRDLVVWSAVGRTKTGGGILLASAPGIAQHADVIPTLMATYRKRKSEPDWYRASDCIEAARRLRINNFSTVANAIGAKNSLADEIRVVRNYYVHRTSDTASKLKLKLLLSAADQLNIIDISNEKLAGGNTRAFVWVSNLRAIGSAAIQ